MPKRRVEIDEEEVKWLYVEEGLTINQIAIIPGMNDNHGIVQGAKPTANGFTWEFDGVDDYIDFG